MVSDKIVCERWCVTKLCDKDACAGVACQCQNAISTTPATQNEDGCHQVLHLPRKMTVDVTKRHTCHAKRRGCRQVLHLPRKMTVDVTKRHACHAKWRGVTGDQQGPSASPDPATCHKCHPCHAKRRWMSPSATPARQNEGGMSPSATPAT